MPIPIQRTLAAALGAVLLLPVARATSSPRMERKQRTEETRIRAEIFVPTHCEGTSYCGERR